MGTVHARGDDPTYLPLQVLMYWCGSNVSPYLGKYHSTAL